MMEKIISVKWEGKPVDVKVGEITWKDKKNSIKEATKVNLVGRSQKKEIDHVLLKELMIIKSIKNDPFPLTVESLDKLTSRDGEKLFKAYSDLNEAEEGDDEGGL